jgi:ribosomal protein L37AE/L43A
MKAPSAFAYCRTCRKLFRGAAGMPCPRRPFDHMLEGADVWLHDDRPLRGRPLGAASAERRARSAGASRQMAAYAARRKCPECGRGGALRRDDIVGQGLVIYTCRYCKHEHGVQA